MQGRTSGWDIGGRVRIFPRSPSLFLVTSRATGRTDDEPSRTTACHRKKSSDFTGVKVSSGKIVSLSQDHSRVGLRSVLLVNGLKSL
jgi:hypothetical protein